MLSRRDVLAALAQAPLVSLNLPSPTRPNVHLIEEPHTLARESCAGFRLLLKQSAPVRAARNLIIFPAARNLTAKQCRGMLQQVTSGACLILEVGTCFSSTQEDSRTAAILQDAFGLRIMPAVTAAGDYINYSWPIDKRVRGFEAVTPVVCADREVLARWRGIPVCCRKQIGGGSVIYLGSMLGPGLFAEEREAHAVGASLLSATNLCASAPKMKRLNPPG